MTCIQWQYRIRTSILTALPPKDVALSNSARAAVSSTNAAGATFDLGALVTIDPMITFKSWTFERQAMITFIRSTSRVNTDNSNAHRRRKGMSPQRPETSDARWK